MFDRGISPSLYIFISRKEEPGVYPGFFFCYHFNKFAVISFLLFRFSCNFLVRVSSSCAESYKLLFFEDIIVLF
ncbi:hypothetical protein CW304_18030 [Bacillus sp. UFRGS-B20]|nr:hypothetical protein CW304_18030 [Bacillus sp. UFRGS-B20]